jgi:hypothetical protein
MKKMIAGLAVYIGTLGMTVSVMRAQAGATIPPGWVPNTPSGQTIDPTVSHDWDASFEILSGFSGSPGYDDAFTFAPNSTYQWSAWVKTQGNQNPLVYVAFAPPGFSGAAISQTLSNGGYILTTIPTGTNDWQKVTTTFTTGQGGPGSALAAINGVSSGTVWIDGVTLTTAIPTPPTISSFAADPSTITSGQSSELSWSVTGADSISISPAVGTVTGNSIAVFPSQTTTYTLTAMNAQGSVTAETTVAVAPSSRDRRIRRVAY